MEIATRISILTSFKVYAMEDKSGIAAAEDAEEEDIMESIAGEAVSSGACDPGPVSHTLTACDHRRWTL